jgi:lipopolysaccharide transport system permease protein
MKFGELPEQFEAAMGVYMFVGVLVWTAIAESLSRCTSVIVENGNLIKKVAFPSEVLPLNQVLVALVTMLFGIAVFVAATLVTQIWIPPRPRALLWVFALLPLQALFTYGLGLAFATLQVYLRDTVHVVTVGLTVWMFATPIFWAPQIVTDSSLGGFAWLVDLNPVYHIVYAWRSVLMSRQPDALTIAGERREFYATPIEDSVLVFAAWALGSFLLGYGFFLLARRRFADEI